MRVTIDRLGINGEGVFKIVDGELTGKVGFVDYVLPEEVVDIEIIKNKSKFCEAKIINVIQKSPHRIEPKCPYYYKCGGCDLQHMNKEIQLTFKRSKVIDTLRKIAKLNDCSIDQCVSINEFEYRNKMVFPFGVVNGIATLGMFRKNSHDIVKIDHCLLAKDEINHILTLSQDFFENSEQYSKYIQENILKYLVVRTYGNNNLITLVLSQKIKLDEYISYICKKIENIGVSIIVGDSDNEILSGKYNYLYGLEKLHIEEFGLKYNVDNRGFLQVNDDVKKFIYEKIISEINADDYVIDAYSGAGLLSSIIAKKAKHVVGIEINSSASKSARELAKINGLHNTKFYNSDVKNVISQCLSEYNHSVLILDPARSGCEDVVLEKILSSNLPKKIIYLSCNVATLSRDLLKLKRKYNIVEIIPYDMFPNTKHVETLVVLERKE